MFTINNKSDYALLLISELTDKKDYLPLSKLVQKTHLPKRFVARIASDLTRHKILESREGKIGGYKLKKSLKQISLLELINIFNHDVKIVKCETDYVCDFGKFCQHRFFFRKVLNKIFLKELNKWTLADLFMFSSSLRGA